ncbi:hypothetical protein M5K25_017516 [Dendrobium thyrsiflorum]|uniref:GST N-terminal domain-containing protein n=1 Tax=Dendrobium thyrsiflorum TaxID=117978 RepID=A0ABD0UMZ2_DENTH
MEIMAGRKVEVLEGELGQIKTDFEEKISNFQNKFSSIHEKMDGRFAALEDLMKKMIDDKQKPASSETIGGHGRGGNPNPSGGRENPEVEVLEGDDGMPPLEPLSREELSRGYDRREADYIGRREEFYRRGAGFERIQRRAFLDYHDIPYKVVEVNPFGKKEIKWSDYKKVPILVVDGEQLVESSDIIDKLNQRIHPEKTILDEEESKWRRWVDEHLVHVLSPNIYRTISEALESFSYITSHGNFSFHERLTAKYAGAAVMYLVSKKLKKKYNITDERAALYEAAETWSTAIDGREFLGGSRPNLADLSVFGVLRPIRYLKAGRDMVENTSIREWYQRMEAAVGESSRLQA